MKKYFVPLGVFVGGQFTMLFCMLFMPALGASVDQLATDTAAMAPTFWNWSWVSGTNVKFLVYFLIELVTLFMTGVAFLKVR